MSNMKRKWLLALLAIMATPAYTSGSPPALTEPTLEYFVKNSTDTEVIVKFDSSFIESAGGGKTLFRRTPEKKVARKVLAKNSGGYQAEMMFYHGEKSICIIAVSANLVYEDAELGTLKLAWGKITSDSQNRANCTVKHEVQRELYLKVTVDVTGTS